MTRFLDKGFAIERVRTVGTETVVPPESLRETRKASILIRIAGFHSLWHLNTFTLSVYYWEEIEWRDDLKVR